MTTKRINLDAVIGMLQRAEHFDDLSTAQQAALRAQVTRTLKATVDPDIVAVLDNIQTVIGVAATRPADRMTADDLLSEYSASYYSYNSRQRAAFKAKVSRLGNIATEQGDAETADAMVELSARIVADEEKAQREMIRKLSENLRNA